MYACILARVYIYTPICIDAISAVVSYQSDYRIDNLLGTVYEYTGTANSRIENTKLYCIKHSEFYI